MLVNQHLMLNLIGMKILEFLELSLLTIFITMNFTLKHSHLIIFLPMAHFISSVILGFTHLTTTRKIVFSSSIRYFTTNFYVLIILFISNKIWFFLRSRLYNATSNTFFLQHPFSKDKFKGKTYKKIKWNFLLTVIKKSFLCK